MKYTRMILRIEDENGGNAVEAESRLRPYCFSEESYFLRTRECAVSLFDLLEKKRKIAGTSDPVKRQREYDAERERGGTAP